MITALTVDHALAIAPHLRESDRAEIRATEGHDVDWSAWAHRIVAIEGHATVGLVDGAPFVMGGFFEVPSAVGQTCGVWMVATPTIETPMGAQVAACLVERGHREAKKRFTHAITWSDITNAAGMHMLARLGYAEGEVVELGGRLFQQFGKALR